MQSEVTRRCKQVCHGEGARLDCGANQVCWIRDLVGTRAGDKCIARAAMRAPDSCVGRSCDEAARTQWQCHRRFEERSALITCSRGVACEQFIHRPLQDLPRAGEGAAKHRKVAERCGGRAEPEFAGARMSDACPIAWRDGHGNAACGSTNIDGEAGARKSSTHNSGEPIVQPGEYGDPCWEAEEGSRLRREPAQAGPWANLWREGARIKPDALSAQSSSLHIAKRARRIPE